MRLAGTTRGPSRALGPGLTVNSVPREFGLPHSPPDATAAFVNVIYRDGTPPISQTTTLEEKATLFPSRRCPGSFPMGLGTGVVAFDGKCRRAGRVNAAAGGFGHRLCQTASTYSALGKSLASRWRGWLCGEG